MPWEGLFGIVRSFVRRVSGGAPSAPVDTCAAAMGQTPRVAMRLRRLQEHAVLEGQDQVPEMVVEVPSDGGTTLVLGRKQTKTAPGKMDPHVSTEHCKVRRCGGDTRPWMEVKVLGAKVFVRRKDTPSDALAAFSAGSTAKVRDEEPSLPPPPPPPSLLVPTPPPCLRLLC